MIGLKICLSLMVVARVIVLAFTVVLVFTFAITFASMILGKDVGIISGIFAFLVIGADAVSGAIAFGGAGAGIGIYKMASY